MSDNEKCQNDPFKEFGPMTNLEVVQKYPDEVWEMLKKQQARIAELEADADRLDWLGNRCRIVERPGQSTADWYYDYGTSTNLRTAIDKARK